MSLIHNFFVDDSGATAIEYGLIASLISVALIASFNLVGSSMEDNYSYITDNVNPVLN